MIIELHANGGSEVASGVEALVRPDDEFGGKAAKSVVDSIANSLAIPDRGVKPTEGSSRGGKGLHLSTVSTIILESFFLSNPNDRAKALDDIDGLARAVAAPVAEAIKQNRVPATD